MALTEDHVREELKKVIDPELFVNIVDLGLIYDVNFEPNEEDDSKQDVKIDMTMTRTETEILTLQVTYTTICVLPHPKKFLEVFPTPGQRCFFARSANKILDLNPQLEHESGQKKRF